MEKALLKKEFVDKENLAFLGYEELLGLARNVHKRFHRRNIELCAIVNAKSGACHNDCTFCAQSRFSKTPIHQYSLRSPGDLLLAAMAAEKAGAHRFSIVTSGVSLSAREFESVCETVQLIRQETNLLPCASLGSMNPGRAGRLREAGLVRYHHNLETSRSYYTKICSTQAYDVRLRTITAAREAGLELCVGGILGLGETIDDWIELIQQIKAIDPESVPINFLDPRPGTPLEDMPLLSPDMAIKAIALFRIMLPHTVLRLAGGRRNVLQDKQGDAIEAGLNGLMIGNYLTTSGPDIEADMALLAGMGLSISVNSKGENASE